MEHSKCNMYFYNVKNLKDGMSLDPQNSPIPDKKMKAHRGSFDQSLPTRFRKYLLDEIFRLHRC